MKPLIHCFAPRLTHLAILFRHRSNLIFPVTTTMYVMSVMAKPLRTDKHYINFIYAHFFQYAILGELLWFIGSMRGAWYSVAIGNLVRIPFFALLFKLMLGLRKIISKLPHVELSNFLVSALLIKGAACMATVLFFAFELISCWIEEIDDTTFCNNTSTAALYLSTFLMFSTFLGIISKALSRSERGEIILTKERLATFNLNFKEKLQICCLQVVAWCAMLLLSSLGVASEYNNTNTLVGMVGLVLLVFIFVIEGWHLLNTHKKNAARMQSPEFNSLSKVKEVKSDRRLSGAQLVEGMTLGGMV